MRSTLPPPNPLRNVPSELLCTPALTLLGVRLHISPEWVDMNALIVYGTRYGATAGTGQVIAQVLRDEGFEVRVVNTRDGPRRIQDKR